jgi:hypothetical protein
MDTNVTIINATFANIYKKLLSIDGALINGTDVTVERMDFAIDV